VPAAAGGAGETGWWNSITAGDFDNDGDVDYVIGGLGANSFFRADSTHPVSMYAKDFNGDGRMDPILTMWMPAGHGVMKEFPTASRDELVRQLPDLKKKYTTYKDFGEATFADLFPAASLTDAYVRHVTHFQSIYLENLGHGQFRMHELPVEAQLAPVYGMVVDDFDGDGCLDLAMTGNDFGNEVTNGRYDAFNGLVLMGDGKGGFKPRTILQSGLFIPGDGKALVRLAGAKGGEAKGAGLLAASQNNGPLKVFRENGDRQWVRLKDDDLVVLIYLRNGKLRREEPGYGTSFLSQSSRMIGLDKSVLKIEIINGRGQKRTIR